jgi:hypothetical protein
MSATLALTTVKKKGPSPGGRSALKQYRPAEHISTVAPNFSAPQQIV